MLGDPEPRRSVLLIASDLPLQGSGRSQTIQMTRAIKFIFAQHGWKAGKYTLAYQSCDDSTAQAGKWDSGKCSANANAYAQNASVVGVIGTFNSGCAEIIVPDPEPRAERPDRDGQPGEHLRRPDARRPGHGGG